MTSTRAPRARSSAVANAQKAGKGSRTVWIIVAGVLVLGFAAVMAVALSQEEPTSALHDNQTASVDITGSALGEHAGQGPAPSVGEPAPEVTGTALGGGEMSITNDGTPKVIGFFTHWCPACQAEVPVVSSWFNAGNAPDDVEFLAVNTGVNRAAVNYPPTAWFEREEWNVPTLLDDTGSSVGRAFGLGAYPYWVVIDADGRVVNQVTGQLSVPEFEQLIEQARTGAG